MDLPQDNEAARQRLISDERSRRLRRIWRALPSAPRCKICTSPFGPPFGPLLRFFGKGKWPGNPRYCGGCFRELYTYGGGAEVECTLLFADVRGSTAMAETMPASQYRALLNRFYATAAEVLGFVESVLELAEPLRKAPAAGDSERQEVHFTFRVLPQQPGPG